MRGILPSGEKVGLQYLEGYCVRDYVLKQLCFKAFVGLVGYEPVVLGYGIDDNDDDDDNNDYDGDDSVMMIDDVNVNVECSECFKRFRRRFQLSVSTLTGCFAGGK